MNRQKRRPVIAGNWKMNLTPQDTIPYAAALTAELSDRADSEIILCVPAVDIAAAVSAFSKSCVRVGGQNLHPADSGAHTGEISGPMLAAAGCSHVIVGHSERRAMGESNELVRQKLEAALRAGLVPILCVGESLQQRENGETDSLLTEQLVSALSETGPELLRRVLVAYEPIWAIGTGRTATPEQAQQVCAMLREVLRRQFGESCADSIRILYGGSMNESNAAELLARPDIDGGLIGGASLDPGRFLRIVRAAD